MTMSRGQNSDAQLQINHYLFLRIKYVIKIMTKVHKSISSQQQQKPARFDTYFDQCWQKTEVFCKKPDK
jgi:hypothetical protein